MLFQFEGRGIKNECMKRVDGNKEHFIWAENDEDDENIMNEVLSCLEPLYPTISRMINWHFLKGML